MQGEEAGSDTEALLGRAQQAVEAGGHLVDPAGPEVVAFVEEVLGPGWPAP